VQFFGKELMSVIDSWEKTHDRFQLFREEKMKQFFSFELELQH
jgi:hypothetical protein